MRSRTVARTTTGRCARASGRRTSAVSSAHGTAPPSISPPGSRCPSPHTSPSRRIPCASSTASSRSMWPDGRTRCWPTTDPAYIAYHDEEWGRPVRDERGLYERLCLEGFQSGLAWITILRKRQSFRAAFAGFDPETVARFGQRDVERLLQDAGIVRHRGKIEAAIANAGATVALRESGTTLAEL